MRRWTGGCRWRCGTTRPAWANGGSGPAQLALAILLAVTDEATAERFYQRFKWDVIAPIEAGPLGAGHRRGPRLAAVGSGDGRGRARRGSASAWLIARATSTLADVCQACGFGAADVGLGTAHQRGSMRVERVP